MDKFLRFSIVFLGTFLVLNFFFAPDESQKTQELSDIEINISDTEYTTGDLVSVSVTNNTDDRISLGKGTPPQNLEFSAFRNGEVTKFSANIDTEEVFLEAHSTKIFEYPDYNSDFFSTPEKYSVTVINGEKKFSENFTVSEPGFFKSLWRMVVWKPVYNGLIFFMNLTAKDLGLSVILLTLVIRLILFIPTQKAMKSQRKMQKIQPELQAIKNKHKGDQQKIAQESMALWKKHGVNPFSSILPLLLQFPFLIALFYVVQEGLAHNNAIFLYASQSFDYDNINFMFLGFMDMLKTPWSNLPMAWLPIVIAVAQYFAMKLSFARMEKQKAKQKEEQKKSGKKEEKPEGFMAEFQQEFQKMNKVFLYFLPAMILVFSFTLPAAVGVYWLISTVFSIGQQYIVNKQVG